jgi:hypothetical protein
MSVLKAPTLLASAAVHPRVPPGNQFIGGDCFSDSDCTFSCCVNTAKCIGPELGAETAGGCGFLPAPNVAFVRR